MAEYGWRAYVTYNYLWFLVKGVIHIMPRLRKDDNPNSLTVGVYEGSNIGGVSPSLNRKLCREGVLVAAKAGSTWRINREELMKYFKLA